MQRRRVSRLLALVLLLGLAMASALAASRVRDDRAHRARRVATQADGPTSVETPRRNELTSRTASEVRARGAAERGELAESLLAAAAGAPAPEAVELLRRITTLGLSDTPESDKLISEAYRRLAGLHANEPARRIVLLGLALQHTRDPGRRALLEGDIAAGGGDPRAFAFDAGPVTGRTARTLGVQDTCTDAAAVPLPYSASGLTIEPGGDHDWFVFEIDEALGAARLRIETLSDMPAALDDDTDLTLCDETCTGAAGGDCDGAQLAFNDDSPMANSPYMSRIDTGCLSNGTYYLSVGGFADFGGADNFTLEIEVVDTCFSIPDEFEPDNDRAGASPIGNTTSLDPGAPLDPDRIRAEIQCHNTFPPPDEDWVKFKLERTEEVRIETACDFPTIFNDFTIDCDADPDTVVRLHYATPKDYGGVCYNFPFAGIPCTEDEDCCDPDLDDCSNQDPFCGPLGDPFTEPDDQPLAINDDKDPSSTGSRIDVCLPLTVPRSASPSLAVRNDPVPGEFHWYVETTASPPDAVIENYKIRVQNLAPCCFEREPNNDFGQATPLCVGSGVHGLYEFSANYPQQDSDLYRFDVTEETPILFETQGPDVFATDTALQLFVGPDANGDFYFTGMEDDDGGSGFLSRLEVQLPPAADLLGVEAPEGCADALTACSAGGDDDDDASICLSDLPGGDDDDDDAADPVCPSYYLNVTSFFLNPDFPYELRSRRLGPSRWESEPNDDLATGAELARPGDSFNAAIDPACDYDTYRISLDTATDLSLETTNGDTVMELVNCSDRSRIACDDDGGPGARSALSGCLPAGDYCVRVRSFGGGSTFDYGLRIGGERSCDPGFDSPPSGDRILLCDDDPAGEFDTCP